LGLEGVKHPSTPMELYVASSTRQIIGEFRRAIHPPVRSRQLRCNEESHGSWPRRPLGKNADTMFGTPYAEGVSRSIGTITIARRISANAESVQCPNRCGTDRASLRKKRSDSCGATRRDITGHVIRSAGSSRCRRNAVPPRIDPPVEDVLVPRSRGVDRLRWPQRGQVVG
jgi:hypothetical protein